MLNHKFLALSVKYRLPDLEIEKLTFKMKFNHQKVAEMDYSLHLKDVIYFFCYFNIFALRIDFLMTLN